jgi:hypothetical protein
MATLLLPKAPRNNLDVILGYRAAVTIKATHVPFP